MRFTAIVFAALLLGPGAASAQDDAAAIDPKAVEIAEASLAYIADSPAVSVSYFVTSDQVFEGREKITFIRSGTNTLVRGKGFHSYAERNDRVREYFHDGKTFTVVAHGEGVYSSVPFAGDFDGLVTALQTEYDVTLPIWELLSASLKKDFLADIERARYMGTTLVAGQEAHHLAFSEYDEDFQLWVSADPDKPVPLMVVGTNPYSQGWPQYHAFLYDWNMDPGVADEFFTFEPGENDREVAFATYAAQAQEADDGADAKSTD